MFITSNQKHTRVGQLINSTDGEIFGISATRGVIEMESVIRYEGPKLNYIG
jgi:hypothetical protein